MMKTKMYDMCVCVCTQMSKKKKKNKRELSQNPRERKQLQQPTTLYANGTYQAIHSK